MKKRFNLLILLFLIVGCASETTIKPESKFYLKKVQNVSVVVDTSLASSEQEREMIEKKLIEKLKGLNIFQVVSKNKETDDIIIKVQIEELFKVSKTDRLLYGALAGRAKVAGYVTLIENLSGKILGNFYVEAFSSGGTIFAGTTEQAIDMFIEKIVYYIQESIII